LTRLASALAYFLSFVGVVVLLFLSFRGDPGVAYTGVLLWASGRAIKVAFAVEAQ